LSRLRSVTRIVALGVLGLGLASIAVGLVLGRRESRVLPVDPAAHFPAEHRDIAAHYTTLKMSYWAAGSILRWGALAGIVAVGGGATLAAMARRRTGSRAFPTALVTSAVLLGFLALASLPLAYQSGYRTERAFGLTDQSSAGWLLDWLREQGFWIAIYSALAAGFLGVIGRWPRRGWTAAAASGVVLAVVGTFLAPRVIDPLFHDFAPLEDPALEREIEALGHRAGIDVNKVVVMDASRRTNRLNAYVTGLGATRQVVLFDNLLAGAPRPELLLVVAHEVGHAAAGHLRKGLLWSIPAIVVGAWGLAALARYQARALGLAGSGDPAGLPLLWLALSLGLFVTNPAMSAVARRMEARADWISLELTRDPRTFVEVEKRLARTNLAPVEPPRWIVFWRYSHPPVLDRLGMAGYWAALEGVDIDSPAAP
jgi:STE24 endopeptidase